MKKIAEVIEKCNDCKHCKLLKSDSDNYSSAAICTQKEGNEFLILYSPIDKNVKSSFNIEIPTNCPLEDYKT